MTATLKKRGSHPSKALLGAIPGKNEVGIAGIGILVIRPKPTVKSAAIVVIL